MWNMFLWQIQNILFCASSGFCTKKSIKKQKEIPWKIISFILKNKMH